MLEAIPKIIVKPYHHLWYVYMIICMYLVVPNLISLLNQIGRHKFRYLSLMLMLLGMVMDYTCQLSWPVMTYHENVAAVKDSFKKMLEDGVYKADLFADL